MPKVMRRREAWIWWHRRKGHKVREQSDLIGLPITVCWTCDISWTPVWGTADTIVRKHKAGPEVP